jgi:hypothetical protein
MTTRDNGKKNMDDVIFPNEQKIVEAIASVTILLFASYIFL